MAFVNEKRTQRIDACHSAAASDLPNFPQRTRKSNVLDSCHSAWLNSICLHDAAIVVQLNGQIPRAAIRHAIQAPYRPVSHLAQQPANQPTSVPSGKLARRGIAHRSLPARTITKTRDCEEHIAVSWLLPPCPEVDSRISTSHRV